MDSTETTAARHMTSAQLRAYIEKVRSVLVDYGYVVKKADASRRRAKELNTSAYQPWYTSDTRTLMQMYRDGETPMEMSKALNRSALAVMAYLCKLEVVIYDQPSKSWVDKRTNRQIATYAAVKRYEYRKKEKP